MYSNNSNTAPVLLSPYLCYISFLCLDLYALGDEVSISKGSLMRTKDLCVLIFPRVLVTSPHGVSGQVSRYLIVSISDLCCRLYYHVYTLARTPATRPVYLILTRLFHIGEKLDVTSHQLWCKLSPSFL